MSVSIAKYQKQDVAIAAAGRWRDIHTANIDVADDCLTRNGSACPICGGTDRFNVDVNYDQTGTVHCRGCTIGGDGFTFLMKANNWRFPKALQTAGEFLNVKPVIHGVETTQRDIASDAERFHQMAIAQNKLEALSESIGVSVRALQVLKAGWNGEAWTFPETDAHGNVIGINRRFPDGSKKQYKGHKRGLMLADAGHDMLYCVEGASDTAAMIDCGLSVIARPSNNGGSAHLSELLRDETRTVFIVGENDQKEVGTWPGLEGALSIASKLKLADVRIALPADGAKDIRDWCSRFPDGDILESLETLTIKEAQARLPQKKQRSDTNGRQYDVTDRNDIGNAAHFAERHKDRLRYCFAWKKWLVWDGTRWKLDSDGSPIRLAKDIVRAIFSDGLDDHDGQVVRLAEESAKASKLQAMISLAAPELPIYVDDLDSNGWLLNCPNGTVDLRTGTLQPHERWQNITKLCPTEFEPTAAAPKWGQFLRDIFVDDDLISFVQRLMGYCLTADVSEQKLPIFHGSGANGKTTLLNAFMDVVGSDYTMQSMPDFLMEKRNESHPTEKASLFGKRFVSCVETEASRKLAESTVKMLTGGEKIMARRMREDFWEFNPSHKLVLCTNHKPIVAGQDHGIWRRLLLVPFTECFKGDRIDKLLPDKLRTEAAGILAWLVRGCMDWQRVGLNPPAIVTDATNTYRTNEDTIGMFVNEQCQTGKNVAVTFKALYGGLTAWCDESGHDCPGKKTVGTWLGENGFSRSRSNGVVWNGLMLNNVSDDSFV